MPSLLVGQWVYCVEGQSLVSSKYRVGWATWWVRSQSIRSVICTSFSRRTLPHQLKGQLQHSVYTASGQGSEVTQSHMKLQCEMPTSRDGFWKGVLRKGFEHCSTGFIQVFGWRELQETFFTFYHQLDGGPVSIFLKPVKPQWLFQNISRWQYWWTDIDRTEYLTTAYPKLAISYVKSFGWGFHMFFFCMHMFKLCTCVSYFSMSWDDEARLPCARDVRGWSLMNGGAAFFLSYIIVGFVADISK